MKKECKRNGMDSFYNKKRSLLTGLILLITAFCALPSFAQNRSISGTVKDISGEAIIGANVQVKGTSTGSITDLNGRFSFDAPRSGTLVVSFIGYTTQEISLATKTNYEIILQEDSKILDEVVVIGYGSMKKADLTGAVVSANIKDFEKAPNTNLMQSLQGTVPGLNVGQSMTAGGTPEISIRGTNTISGNTNVLIVLDGIIYNGSMSSINPADVESIDVLKDASATAVYGAQAANGVLLITSKKGKMGKAKINFSSSYSFQNPTKNLRPMNRDELISFVTDAYWNESYTEESGYTQKNPDFNLANRAPYAFMTDGNGNMSPYDTDWWGDFTRTGTILENKFSISGGNEGMSYMISLGNTIQKNMIKNDDFARNSIRVNLDIQPRKWWKAGVQAFGSFVNQDGTEPYLPFLLAMSPLARPFDDEGKMIDYPMDNSYANPYHGSDTDDYDRQNYFFANLYTEFQLPLKGLTYRINFGNNYNIREHHNANPYGNNRTGTVYKEHNTYYDYTFDNIVNYANDFGKHGVGATFVYGAIRRKNSYTKADTNTYDRMVLGYNSLEQAKNQYTYSDAWKETMLYQMFRVNYKFDNRYLVTATIRRDGFSGFAANNKTAIFPSIALGWVVSDEAFFKIDWMNYLKLRGGYGVSGNQTSRYASLAKVTSEIGYIYGDNATGSIRQELTSLANKNLKWEKTGGFNFGVDYGFLNNRITGSLEVYRTITRDLLYNVTIPTITGFSSIASNVGKLENKGIEFTITSHNIVTKDFEWTTTFNISSNSNKIKSLTGLDLDGDGKEDDLSASGLFIGQPLTAIYDYKTNGIYQLGDKDIPDGYYPGSLRIVDTDGKEGITPDDRVILGKTDPAYRFGILNKFTYKGITLSFFINSVQGGKDGYLGRNSASMTESSSTPNNLMKELGGLYWSPVNTGGIYPNAEVLGQINPNYYQQRSFVRLQDVTLSYDLPKSIVSKIGLDGVNIFFNGKNLLTFTDWHGWDPEPNNSYTENNITRVSGCGYSNRPVMRSFTGGINISF